MEGWRVVCLVCQIMGGGISGTVIGIASACSATGGGYYVIMAPHGQSGPTVKLQTIQVGPKHQARPTGKQVCEPYVTALFNLCNLEVLRKYIRNINPDRFGQETSPLLIGGRSSSKRTVVPPQSAFHTPTKGSKRTLQPAGPVENAHREQDFPALWGFYKSLEDRFAVAVDQAERAETELAAAKVNNIASKNKLKKEIEKMRKSFEKEKEKEKIKKNKDMQALKAKHKKDQKKMEQQIAKLEKQIESMRKERAHEQREVGSNNKNRSEKQEFYEKQVSLFVGQVDKTQDFALKMSETIGDTISKCAVAFGNKQ